MSTSHENYNYDCCKCLGPQGVQGMQGMQGPMGLQGLQGVAGPMGPQGMAGPQGVMGLQGTPGKDCMNGGGGDCHCCDRYFNLFKNQPQTVGAYLSATDTVLFDSQNIVSTGDFDLTLMGTTGDIKFLKHGIYHLAWQLQASIIPPVPVPVPSWAFAFWLNNVLVQGSTYSGFTQAPGDSATHSSGDVIVEVKANDLLRLRNVSNAPVSLNPSIPGSVFPISIVSLNVECLKELP